MKRQYPYGKGCSTPVPKGLLTYCPSCINYISQSGQEAKIKYPCKLSHSQIRRGDGINYARDFKDCAFQCNQTLFSLIPLNIFIASLISVR